MIRTLFPGLAMMVLLTGAMFQAAPVGTWAACPTGPEAFLWGGYATDGTYLYHFRSSAFGRFNPATGVWETLTGIPQYIDQNAGAYYDGSLYSFGGTLYPPLPTGPVAPPYPIYRYDIAQATWTLLPDSVDMHGASASAASLNGKIYITGGLGQTAGWSDALTEFDPVTETLTPLAPMPVPRAWHTSAADPVSGKLYVIGGRAVVGGVAVTYDSVYEYDPATDVWTEVAPLPSARFFCQAFALDGKIYATGGWTALGAILNETQAYDPATDTWTADAPMALGRFAHAAVVIDGKGYVYGGSDTVTGSPVPTSCEEFTAATPPPPPPPPGGGPGGTSGRSSSGGGGGCAAGAYSSNGLLWMVLLGGFLLIARLRRTHN